MLQILLAADEKLQKAIVGPLEARGCSVRVVRGLSEVVDACAIAPHPQVIAAALPVSAGGPQAITELKSSAKNSLPPLLILLPPNRGSEAPALKAAGAADVFESPLKLSVFLARARELAAPPKAPEPAPPKPVEKSPSPVAALLSEELSEASIAPAKEAPTAPAAPAYNGPPRWPATVTPLDACLNAAVAYSVGETPVDFDREVLQGLFRVMTDIEVRSVKDFATAARQGAADSVDAPTRLFSKVTAERLRVRLALTAADKQVSEGTTAIDEAALSGWLKELDGFAAEIQPYHQRAVSSGDIQNLRQLNLVTDALGRLRRDLENGRDRVLGRSAAAPATGGLIDEALPPPPGPGVPSYEAPKTSTKAASSAKVLNVESVSHDELKQERKKGLMVALLIVGGIIGIGITLWSTGTFQPAYEYPQGIPDVQYVEYYPTRTRAVVNTTFDVAKWGYALEQASKNTKRIDVEANGHVIASIEGDVAHVPGGADIKLEKSTKTSPAPSAGTGGQTQK